MIIYVYDKLGNQKDVICDFVEFFHEEELGTFDFIDFTVVDVHVNKYDYIVWKDDKGLWHENIVSTENVSHNNGIVLQTVHAPNSIVETNRNYFGYSNFYTGLYTGSHSPFSDLINETRWSLGQIDEVDSDSLILRNETVLEGLSDLIKVSKEDVYYTTDITVGNNGVEKRILNFVKNIGEDRGIIYEYGFDVENVKREVSTDEIITRLHCFGKEIGENESDEDTYIYRRYKRRATFTPFYGRDYVEDNAAKEKYGIPDKDGVLQHSEGIYIDDRYEDYIPLYHAGSRRLKEVSKPRVSYSAKIYDFFKRDYYGTGISLGDTVTVVDRVLDETIVNRIVRIRKDYINEYNTELTLGNTVRTKS